MRKIRLYTVTLIAVLVMSSMAYAQITITYMHRTVPLETQWAEAVAAAFEARNPGIKVELISGGGGAGFFEKLATMMAAGVPPDVHFGSADRLMPIHNDWILPLNELVERDAADIDIDDYLPGVFDSYVVDGKLYGMVLMTSTQVVYWNKDMFAEHGLPPLPVDWDSREWTWDELIDYSARLTRVAPDGSAAQLGLSQATDMYLPDVTWMFGGDWFPPEAYERGIATSSTMTRPENIRAFEALQHLYLNYAAQGPYKGIDVRNGFQQGLIGMDWIGTWKLKHFLQSDQDNVMGFAWGMAPVPRAVSRVNTRWTDALFIAKDTPHVEAAWEFVKFATGVEGQRLWTELTGDIPTRISVLPVYTGRVSELMGMPERDLQILVAGAVAHSRRALEESILGTGQLFSQNMRRWFYPILTGTVAPATGLEQVQRELDGHLDRIAKDYL